MTSSKITTDIDNSKILKNECPQKRCLSAEDFFCLKKSFEHFLSVKRWFQTSFEHKNMTFEQVLHIFMRSHRSEKRILNVNLNIFIFFIIFIIIIIIIGISGIQWYRPHAVA